MSSSPFVLTLTPPQGEKLKKDLLTQGFTLSTPPHTFFAAKGDGVSCQLYLSGKLVIQGKKSKTFIVDYIEPNFLPTLSYSYPHLSIDMTPRMGLDEAGKGDFFGPLTTAALYANTQGIEKLLEWGVQDSKNLKDPQILQIAKKIRGALPYTIVKLFPPKYNELYSRFRNLNTLLAWCHATALVDLSEKTGCQFAILDQFADERVMERILSQKLSPKSPEKLPIDLQQRTKGEEDIVVAGASILARAAFVEGIASLETSHNAKLPKGASPRVIEAGKAFISLHGKEHLGQVAKLHFSTTKKVIPPTNSSSSEHRD